MGKEMEDSNTVTKEVDIRGGVEVKRDLGGVPMEKVVKGESFHVRIFNIVVLITTF